MRNALVLLPAVAAMCLGCGINQEQLRKELDSERRWTEQQQTQTLDALRLELHRVTETTDDLAARLRSEMDAVKTSVAALQKDVDHLTADIGTIKVVAAAMQTTNTEGIDRLERMQKLHDEFLASVDTLDQKIQISQEKYRDIIRKRISSLKEQYTYMSNLLRELETDKGGSENGGGAGNDNGGGGDGGK